jgi:hypothetical protein
MGFLKLQSNSVITSWEELDIFLTLQTSVVTTDQCTVTVNSDELTDNAEYLTL